MRVERFIPRVQTAQREVRVIYVHSWMAILDLEDIGPVERPTPVTLGVVVIVSDARAASK
jgi:hypothetical protein